jgi:sodium-dependent dicarboxylate transporter 2/3/5
VNSLTHDERHEGRARHQWVGLFLGPLLAIAMLLAGAPEGLGDAAWRTAAIGVLMAVWWATEAVPIAVTALLPLVVFPMLDIASIHDTARPYSNKVIYLFLGGFIVAFAMQRWNLHRRIALNVLQVVGGNGRSLVGGFMIASATISMWVMNTSTTMMLLPIALSIIGVIHTSVAGLTERGKRDFQYALLLGIAYSATIGGMTTLVGTVPNALLAAFMLDTYGSEIDFARWMLVGIPLAIVMLPLSWLVLTRVVFKVDFLTSAEASSELRRMKEEMGSISVPESRVAIIFACMALLWMTRPLLTHLPGLGALDDSGIAMAGAIAQWLERGPVIVALELRGTAALGRAHPVRRRIDARERGVENRAGRMAGHEPAGGRRSAALGDRRRSVHDDHLSHRVDQQYRHDGDVSACCGRNRARSRL